MINALPGAAKYVQQRQRYADVPHCNVKGCSSGYRYLTASGAMFCGIHWRYYIAVKVLQYNHQQAMLEAIKQRKDFNNASLRQNVLEVCSMENDEVLQFLTQHDTIVSIVDDINIGGTL